jgi:uncharacterized membrane protein
MTAPISARHPLSPMRATGRLILSIVVGIATAALVAPHSEWWLRALAGWDTASLTLSVLAWAIIMTTDAEGTRHRAGGDDPGRMTVFIIGVASSLVSLMAAGLVLQRVKGLPPAEATMWTVVAIGAVVLSWILTHTSYTFRYANLYYRGGKHRERAQSACLDFPGEKDPADIDFAYFAFTVGMCFQVSDVAVTTNHMRREVLAHAALSFFYNTMILALTLNVVASVLS